MSNSTATAPIRSWITWRTRSAPIFERHGTTEAPSTRYKDFVDLVAIVLAASLTPSHRLRPSIRGGPRGLRLPKRLTVPDRGLWEPGYAAEAERSLLPMAQTLDAALAAVRPFLDPLLDGRAYGTWHPQHGRWTG